MQLHTGQPRVATLSTGKLLDTIPKNNLRGITLDIRPVWGVTSLTLHALFSLLTS